MIDSTLPFPQIADTCCTGCGECVTACVPHALVLMGRKAALVNPQQCNYCAACEAICLVGAISVPYWVVLEDRPH